jgi:hypothetical protein
MELFYPPLMYSMDILSLLKLLHSRRIHQTWLCTLSGFSSERLFVTRNLKPLPSSPGRISGQLRI